MKLETNQNFLKNIKKEKIAEQKKGRSMGVRIGQVRVKVAE